tara:strand:+ start:406 stop:774 length:369 start_codon:yes stop_codon:yes gene_type:complete
MSFFLGNKNYDDGLNLAVQRMCNNNLRLKKKCEKEMILWKLQKGKPKNANHMRLLNKALKRQYEDLQVDMSIQLLNVRMYQFVRWFSYMYGKMPILNSKTYNRMKTKYPYKTTGFGRCIKVI